MYVYLLNLYAIIQKYVYFLSAKRRTVQTYSSRKHPTVHGHIASNYIFIFTRVFFFLKNKC